MRENNNSLPALLFALPGALWRHPRGKPGFAIAAALAALWSGWLFVFQILLLVAFALFVVFYD